MEASRHVPAGVFLSYGEESAHMTPEEARQLRDELRKLLGEPASAEAPIRVGDRVVVVAEYPSAGSRLDGRTGVVVRLDPGDPYPYLVVVDGDGDDVWCHSVRRTDEPAEDDPELADHLRVSAAQDAADAADFDRRHSAAVKAREILRDGAPGYRPGGDPEPVIRLASWLLGETD
ncbi:hypothetical protein [Kitasatospora purpeofusca]|uniref:hypothetical protein n=1 Tax=Kitasatospora purpeofusca TaxID=67352 RepID=UPI0036873447